MYIFGREELFNINSSFLNFFLTTSFLQNFCLGHQIGTVRMERLEKKERERNDLAEGPRSRTERFLKIRNVSSHNHAECFLAGIFTFSFLVLDH